MSVGQGTPNSLRGADAPDSRPTSTAACGSAPGPRTQGCVEIRKVPRILRVRLIDLTHEDWLDLLLLARESARFCNATMADFYARELGYAAPNGESVFVRFKQRLSGDVRVALGREAFTQWRMRKHEILRGDGRLAFFTDKRALVCRAEHLSHGKRQRHAWIWSDDRAHYLSICLIGRDSERVIGCKNGKLQWGRRGERHNLKLWWKPQIDERHRPVMDGLAAGVVRLLKVSFIFERPGKKVFALLTYEKDEPIINPGSASATLGPLEPDGSLWMRVEGGNRYNYTHWVHELIAKKEHWAGLAETIRSRTRRAGPGAKQDYRRALLKAGSFSKWAHGRLHQLSADIVKSLVTANVGHLTIAPIAYQDLPMAELEEKLKYKAAENGITIERLDPNDKPTSQAMERAVSRSERSAAKVRRALRVVREAVEDKEKT